MSRDKHLIFMLHYNQQDRILTKGTIDEDVMTTLTRKEETQASLIDAVKAKLEVMR